MHIQTLLSDVIHQTFEGITLSDPSHPDNPLIFANDSFCRITGYERDEILGKNCRFLQGANTCKQTVATIRQSLQAEEPATFEIYNYRKNGQGFWNRLALAPIHQNGKLVCHVGIQLDISEHKETLQHLQTHHNNLLNVLQKLSHDTHSRMQDIDKAISASHSQKDNARFMLQQLTLLKTILENDSAEILDFVKQH